MIAKDQTVIINIKPKQLTSKWLKVAWDIGYQLNVNYASSILFRNGLSTNIISKHNPNFTSLFTLPGPTVVVHDDMDDVMY